MSNIVNGGYAGKVYPVNPKGGEIFGLPVCRNISQTETPPDVAVISIPAAFVYDTVKACGERGVKYAAVISSGFSEVGHLDEEKRIVALAHEYGMRILGPNIFGHYSSTASLNATFGPGDIPRGNVAIITQSGALGVAMIGKTAVQKIGLSAIISVGNKSDLDEADLLEYLMYQEDTQAIFMYIEGIQHGERLVSVLDKATRRKPVVVIKSGRSKKGAIAAASHTGSLAGSDEIFDAIMKQCGVLRAESIQEALDWCKYISNSPLPDGENTLIVTNGGGVGVLATDACEKYQVKLYEDKVRLRELFQDITHGFGSTKNPVDLTGDATEQEYTSALLSALEDDKIHAVISLYCETAMMNSRQLVEMIRNIHSRYKEAGMPVVFSLFGGEVTEAAVVELTADKIPVFRGVYDSVSPLGALFRHYRHLKEPSIHADARNTGKIPGVKEIVDKARQDQRSFLLAHEGQQLLEIMDLPGPESRVARNIKEAVTYAAEIGFPVVMKVVSRDILHKSDVGGVLLNLEDEEEVMDAWQTIIHNCKAYKQNAVIEGIEVAQQIPPGTEVIIGARRDKNFGPIIMFGLGGIYVEVMKDVSFRALPLTMKEARLMVKGIRSYPLLLGVRGEKRKDIDAIIETIFRVGNLLQNCPEISDIEINPMIVYERGEGIKAVDVRVLLSESVS